jgi:hypothetical protein
MSEQKKKEINKKLDDLYDLLFLYFRSEGRDLTSEGFVEFDFYDYNLQMFKIGIGESLKSKIKDLNIDLDILRSESPESIDSEIKSKIKDCNILSFSDKNIDDTFVFGYADYRLALELILYKNLEENEIIDFLLETKEEYKSTFPIYFLFVSNEEKLLETTKELNVLFDEYLFMLKIYGDLEMLNLKIEKILNASYLEDYFKFTTQRLICLFNLLKEKRKESNKISFERLGFGDIFSNTKGYKNENILILEAEHDYGHSISGNFNKRIFFNILKRMDIYNNDIDENDKKLKLYINPSKEKLSSETFENKKELISLDTKFPKITFNQKKANKECVIARKRLEDNIMNNFLEELDNPLRDANKYFDILKINESLKERNVNFFEGIKYFLESPNAKERFLKDKVFNDEFLDLIELEKSV